MGDDLIAAVKEFFVSGTLLREVNATIITLALICQNPSHVTDFRPISCCNTIYKCITKILANRLNKCLPTIISKNPSAFVEGIRIIENILLGQEVV